MCMCSFVVIIILQIHGSDDTNTSKNSSKAKSKGNHNFKKSLKYQSAIDLSIDQCCNEKDQLTVCN